MIVRHSRGEYPIHWRLSPDFLRDFEPSRHFLLTDQTVWELWLSSVWPADRAVIVPAGESSKSIPVYESCVRKLAEARVHRSETLIAVGGGVVGDLGGFVAATVLRGIPFVQVPTTMMSMLDSSVGGKVGIDLPEGKNLVGSFWPPITVEICPQFLSTLPKRHVANGLAEAIKMGFIRHPELLAQVKPTLESPVESAEVIRSCIQAKAAVVEEDEFETTGVRATLNFGHTVGDAIEQVVNYEDLLHGVAVAIGMVAEALIGERLGFTERGIHQIVRRACEEISLPTRHSCLIEPDRLIECMKRDKKSDASGISMSLLSSVGTCKLVRKVEESAIRESLMQL